MDPYRALNCEPRIENRGGPGAVVKCNGFAWFSFALSARACLRSISLKFRMCSAALVATTWGLHDAKWRCSKNAFREEPDYLADCTVRDAMVVPPCFPLFASAPPPDRKAAPMRDVYLHRTGPISLRRMVGACGAGFLERPDSITPMHVSPSTICSSPGALCTLGVWSSVVCLQLVSCQRS